MSALRTCAALTFLQLSFKGFPDAISAVYPKTEIQLCVVHQIRNSLKYIISRDQKAFMQDLKCVYKATSKDLAEHHLLELDEKWGKKYPAVIKSWQTNWESLSQYFKYPEELRRIIYTTNIVKDFIVKSANIVKIRAHLLVKMLW